MAERPFYRGKNRVSRDTIKKRSLVAPMVVGLALAGCGAAKRTSIVPGVPVTKNGQGDGSFEMKVKAAQADHSKEVTVGVVMPDCPNPGQDKVTVSVADIINFTDERCGQSVTDTVDIPPQDRLYGATRLLVRIAVSQPGLSWQFGERANLNDSLEALSS